MYYEGIFLERLGKIMKNLNQEYLYSGQIPTGHFHINVRNAAA
jgi:hypothetical protein